MTKIKTSDLKEGMMFDKPVYISGENLLVPPNVPLKKKDIDRLQRWEIKEVETEGVVVTQAEKDLFDLQNIASKDSPAKKEGFDLYISFVNNIDEIFKNIKNKNEEKIAQYVPALEAIAKDILIEVEKKHTRMLEYVARRSKKENSLATSSVNCSILSAIIGLQLDVPRAKILTLITGALLHDSGMLRISAEVLNKKDRLKDEELRQIKTHTLISYMIITKEMKMIEEIAAIGIYHHERWDGTGYPKKLKAEEIPLFARIVSVADAYEAMINKRPYRKPLIGYTAIKNILNDNGTHFDPNILKIFLKCMGIYPIGSYVLLNNNCIGKVVDLNITAPMRPTIEIMLDSSGKKVAKHEKTDLAENNNIFIIKAVDPESIEELSNE
jgi:HD-GYP domain-containing protein (c-di-GMP phosphodiesterase class II)